MELVDYYRRVMSKYDCSASKVSLLTHNWDFIHRYWCGKDSFNHIIEMPFEGTSIPVPENYDEILSNIYGNYMEFPPLEKRGKWHEEMILFEPDIPYKEYYKGIIK